MLFCCDKRFDPKIEVGWKKAEWLARWTESSTATWPRSPLADPKGAWPSPKMSSHTFMDDPLDASNFWLASCAYNAFYIPSSTF